MTGRPRTRFVTQGQRYGKLVVVDPEAGHDSHALRVARARCDCGATALVPIYKLLDSAAPSCGCTTRERQQGRRVSAPPRPRLSVTEGQEFGRLTVVDPEVPPPPGMPGKPRRWVMVRCACGTTKEVRLYHLLRGSVASCGCLGREVRAERNRAWVRSWQNIAHIRRVGALPQTHERALAAMGARPRPEKPPAMKHGLSRHELYHAWYDMVDHCTNPASPAYRKYGRQGITVHPAWRDDPREFINWVEANLGPRPPGLLPGNGRQKQPLYALDRIDKRDGFRPGNLHWVKRSGPRPRQQQGRPLPAATGPAP